MEYNEQKQERVILAGVHRGMRDDLRAAGRKRRSARRQHRFHRRRFQRGSRALRAAGAGQGR